MSDLTERPEQDPEPELTQAPSGHDRESDDEEEALAICREQQLEEELRYRYCDDPFCGYTYDKLRFLTLVGIFQDGCLTREARGWSTSGTPTRTHPRQREHSVSTDGEACAESSQVSAGGMSSPRGFWCLPGYEPQQQQHWTPSP